MCDAYNPPAADGSTKELTPIPTNTRFACAKACKAAEAEDDEAEADDVDSPMATSAAAGTGAAAGEDAASSD